MSFINFFDIIHILHFINQNLGLVCLVDLYTHTEIKKQVMDCITCQLFNCDAYFQFLDSLQRKISNFMGT